LAGRALMGADSSSRAVRSRRCRADDVESHRGWRVAAPRRAKGRGADAADEIRNDQASEKPEPHADGGVVLRFKCTPSRTYGEFLVGKYDGGK